MEKEEFFKFITSKGFWLQAKKQIKIYIVAVIAAGGSVWAVAEYYLEDYVRATATQVIEDKHGNKSFREVLGEKMGIPEDEVAIRLVERLDQIDTVTTHIMRFESRYAPHLDFQLRISPMYRYLDEDGVQWWMGPDRRSHGVLFDNGEAWCVYSNQKTIIGNSY